jgi:hypothetical protein
MRLDYLISSWIDCHNWREIAIAQVSGMAQDHECNGLFSPIVMK